MSSDRSTLKGYFKKGKIPTENNFAELIDGMLNQADDGIFKSGNNPLSIKAVGDGTNTKTLLNFYDNAAGVTNPDFKLQLNPVSGTPPTPKLGLSISDGGGVSRLFIDKSSGNLGLGTINPQGKLDIADVLCIGQDKDGSGLKSISFVRNEGDDLNAGKITYGGSNNSDSLSIIGAGKEGRKIKLFDHVFVNGNLKVTDIIAHKLSLALDNDNNNRGVLFLACLNDFNHAIYNNSSNIDGEGNWDGAKWNAYRLNIRVGNKDAKPTEMKSALFIEYNGNVGIGTPDPHGKLHIINTSQSPDGSTLILGPTNSSNLRLGYHDDYSWVQSHGLKPLILNLNSNNVGIGTSAPKSKLSVIGERGKTSLHVKGSVRVEPYIDSVMNFNKTNYIALPEMTLDFKNGLTIEVWVLIKDFNKGYHSKIIELFDSNQSAKNILLFTDSISHNITFSIFGVLVGSRNYAITENYWTHLAVTVASDGAITVYMDGRMVSRGSCTIPSTKTNTTIYNFIGKSNEHPREEYFFGYMHDLRIWKVAHTQEEIQNNMYVQASSSANLFAHYPLDHTNGANDLSDYKNNGTIMPNNAKETFFVSLNNIIIDDLGYVGIGVNHPNYRLDVDGIVNASNISGTSDISAKKDIEDLHYGLAEVNKLRPVSFNWKMLDNPHKTLGLIAQEVKCIINEVIFSNESADDKGTLSISYMNLIPILINAIKELDIKIKRLEKG